MASPTKNVLSLIALLILVVGTFSTVMIVLADKRVVQQLWGLDYYKVGSALGEAVAVLILIYLTVTSVEKSISYKILIISVLLIGLVAEIIMNNVKLNLENEEYGRYAVIVFNFLYRSYYLIGYIQEPWAELTFQTVNKGIKSVTAPITGTSSSSTSSNLESTFRNKFREYKTAVKGKYSEGYDNTEAEKIINAAVADNEMTNAKLAEAAAALKTKSGETITGISIPTLSGGKRHR